MPHPKKEVQTMRESILTLFFILSIAARLSGAEPIAGDLSPRQAQIEAAIMHVMETGFPEHDIYPARGNPVYKNRVRRMKLVRAIDYASEKHGVSPMFLVTMSFREGSFVGKEPGGLGEMSMFQMMEYNAARIRREIDPECTLKTVEGSAICAAAWLDHWRKKCGSLHGALVVYATGKKCKPFSSHLVWLLRDRFGIARKLEAITGYVDKPDSLTLIANSESRGNS
jgi:hypothetical protein